MLITDVQLPPCNKCGHPNLVIEKLPGQPVDGKETHQFFVLCKGPVCGQPDGKGFRPLTNGMPSQHAAEEAWRSEAGRNPFKAPR